MSQHTELPAIPTDEELLDRIRDLVPLLVSRQAETEARAYYSEDTHEAFRAAGFYRMLVPKRYGGFETNLATYFRVVREMARGCPSTAWMFSLGASHAITAASFYSEAAQDEIFAEPDFIAPSTAKVQGTATRAEDGGWRVSGTWNYCSGAPYSTHLIVHAMPDAASAEGEPQPMMLIAPRSQYTVLDDWGGQLGLKGSGSHSCQLEDAWIPEHFATPGETFLTLGPAAAVGKELHGNAIYGGSTFTLYTLDGANIATGTVMGARDEYERLLATKPLPGPPFTSRTTDPDYQAWYGMVCGQLATAEAALEDYCQQWMELSERDTWAPEDDHRLTGIANQVVNTLCIEAMLTMVKSAGSSAIRDGERMARAWRDFSQLYSHGVFFLYGVMARELTRHKFAAAPSSDPRSATAAAS